MYTTVLPATSCPACWQPKDDLSRHYCTPCHEEFNRDYTEPHGPDCCDDTTCRLCFSQTGDNDHPDDHDTDPDYDEPYGADDFRGDVGL